jgi:PTH2 family peptidyl-tRNA hydrolase
MVKQVIVVNQALNLPKGKLAVQVAHAAVSAFLFAGADAQAAWLRIGMPKIVVGAAGEDELLRLRDAAERSGVPAALVQDAGKTVLLPGTVTCVGLGPAPIDLLDTLTGGLKLL